MEIYNLSFVCDSPINGLTFGFNCPTCNEYHQISSNRLINVKCCGVNWSLNISAYGLSNN